jgi:hypothetical protein
MRRAAEVMASAAKDALCVRAAYGLPPTLGLTLSDASPDIAMKLSELLTDAAHWTRELPEDVVEAFAHIADQVLGDA